MSSSVFNLFGTRKKPRKRKYLMEFRAGKMKLNDDNWVYPDKRKGLVYIHQTMDGLMHFCWKDRITDNVEDDLIIFPDETIFKRLPECQTGRAYLLKFKDSKKLFLWMQEPLEENDENMCRKVNEILNQKSTNSKNHQTKTVNINDLNSLLGELNEIGALNNIDLLELLVAGGLESHGRSESDMLGTSHINRFTIGTSTTTPTDPEQFTNRNQLTDGSKFGFSLADSQITKYSFSNLELCSILSDNTLVKLSQNPIFQTRVLLINDENSENIIKNLLIKNSKEYENAMMTFCDILLNESTGADLLNEMGLPNTVISSLSEADLSNVLLAIEHYYSEIDNKKL